MTPIHVTVVVCTYNRAELLREALASLMALRTDGEFRYEIVVVDNGSTDHTDRVIENTLRHPTAPLRVVREPRAGVAHARNCGIRWARGRWIAFFDDDQIAEEDWLRELIGAARRSGALWVGGTVRLALPDEVLDDLPPLCRNLLGELVVPGEPQRTGNNILAGTGNLLVERTVFERIGVFDASLREAGEDSDLHRRMRAAGIDGCFAPSAVVRHVVPDYRLGEAYFRWTSLRNGMHVARRDRENWGWAGFPLILALRFAQAAVHFLPCWLWGRVAGSRRRRLRGRCLLWRAQGYFRLVLSWTSPSRFGADLLSETDFRTERERFAGDDGTKTEAAAAHGPTLSPSYSRNVI